MREGEAFTRRYKRDWETKSVYASTALHYRFLYASRKNMKIFKRKLSVKNRKLLARIARTIVRRQLKSCIDFQRKRAWVSTRKFLIKTRFVLIANIVPFKSRKIFLDYENIATLQSKMFH